MYVYVYVYGYAYVYVYVIEQNSLWQTKYYQISFFFF